MTTRRTPLHRPPVRRVSPEALAAFDTGDVLTLHRALGLKPWESSPLEVDDGRAPEWVSEADWNQAQGLRRALTELLGR